MRLLLDTCTFLWLVLDSPQLSPACRSLFQDPHNEAYLSVVSCWEMVVKHAQGRLPLPGRVEEYVRRRREEMRIQSLPLSEEAVLQHPRLPLHHKDPFDRMLICQAITEGMALLTPDPLILQYPVRTLW